MVNIKFTSEMVRRGMKAAVGGILISALLLSGCKKEEEAPAAPAPLPVSADEEEADKKEEPVKPEKTEEKKEEPIVEGDGLIRYTWQRHPLELKDGEVTVAGGNYLSLEPEKADGELYPKLAAFLVELNKKEEKDMRSQIEEAEEEVLQQFNEGLTLAYGYDRDFIPVRSDERVFSYGVMSYTYLGGAHGVTSYETMNMDPKTGRAIPLSAVLEKSDGFEEIMTKELLEQNEDLKEYFGEMEGGVDTLTSDNKERLENDGAGLNFAIDYDGLQIFYEDYAMGSYAAGSRTEFIRFEDYPEYFTDTYVNYKDAKQKPDINELAKELKDAEAEVLKTKKHLSDEAVAAAKEAGLASDSSGSAADASGSDTGEGEDWWYDIKVTNPGWGKAYIKGGIDPEPGKSYFELKETFHNTSDYLDPQEWSRRSGLSLPARLPYEDDRYSYTFGDDGRNLLFLNVYDKQAQTLIGGYNFSDYANPPYGDGSFSNSSGMRILHAVVSDGTLYVSIGHLTYTAAAPNTGFILAVDMESGDLLWKSSDQVCNSDNFLIWGEGIICGYGFTDESDYIYTLNKRNGRVLTKLKVLSKPCTFIPMGHDVCVLTYNTEYVYGVFAT